MMNNAKPAPDTGSGPRGAFAVRLGLVGAAVWVALTILVSPWRPVTPQQIYAVGDIAQVDIKAPLGFQVEDEESTLKRREEQERKVLPVFDHNTNLVALYNQRIREAFREIRYRNRAEADIRYLYSLTPTVTATPSPDPESGGRKKTQSGVATKSPAVTAIPTTELIYGPTKFTPTPLPTLLPDSIRFSSFTDSLGFVPNDETLRVLDANNFGERIENVITRIISELFLRGIAGDKTAIASALEKGKIVIRNLEDETETTAGKKAEQVITLEDARVEAESLANYFFPDDADLSAAVISVALPFFTVNFAPNFDETNSRIEQAIEMVEPAYFVIKKGQIIVRAGDPVDAQAAKKLENLAQMGNRKGLAATYLGNAFLMLILVLALIFLVHENIDDKRFPLKYISLVLSMLVTMAFLARFLAYIGGIIARTSSVHPVDTPLPYLYAIPFAAGAIMTVLLVNQRIAIIYSVSFAVVGAMIVRTDLFMFLFILVSSVCGVLAVRTSGKRSSINFAGLTVSLANLVMVLPLALKASHFLDFQTPFEMGTAFIGGFFSAGVASATLPAFENLFKITTNTRLLELSNQDHPLLKQMLVEAPGTYQHSRMVAYLGEAVAEEVGANPLLVRVGAYYHDIGKMRNSEYFVENQHGGNKHDALAPSMSALVITKHVKEGVELAGKYKLGQEIIDIIEQHHGTGVIKYFYSKAKEQAGPEDPPPDEESFRYPGPKPQTKEAAITMIVDVLEAAVRTLKVTTPKSLQDFIHKLIMDRLLEGQFDEAPITLRDLARVERKLVRMITAIKHERIKYPDQDSRTGMFLAPGGEKNKDGKKNPESQKF